MEGDAHQQARDGQNGVRQGESTPPTRVEVSSEDGAEVMEELRELLRETSAGGGDVEVLPTPSDSGATLTIGLLALKAQGYGQREPNAASRKRSRDA
jgi:hypothetical protein